MINPGETHQYFKSEDCCVIMCIMSEKYSADFTTEFKGAAFPNLLKNHKANERIYNLLKGEFSRQHTNFFIETKAFVNQMYSVLCRSYPLRKHEPTDLLLNRVLEYVYQHYREPLTVESVAEKFSYSPVTIGKMFQKKINVDFRVFVNNVRSDMVHTALRDPQYQDWQLIQIVGECGFNSMATFYRSYRRRYNSLPEKRQK